MRLAIALLLAIFCTAAAAQAELAAAPAGIASVPDRAADGFSSVNLRYDGTYWLLRSGGAPVLHHVHIDWQRGSARILGTMPLPEPVSAMQVLDDSAWFADGGAQLVETDLHGRLLGRYAGAVDGAPLSATARGRFGGVAVSHDGRRLYAAFDRALWRDGRSEADAAGREYVRVLEFDLRTRRWTGASFRYALEANGNTVGDLRFVDSRTALVVERGSALLRIYRVLVEAGAMTKAAYVDLRRLDVAAGDGIDIVDPGYLVLSRADRRSLVLLRSPDLVFPAFERSRP